MTAVPAAAPLSVSLSARAGNPTASVDLTAVAPAATVPDIPTGLSATATHNEVTLTWDDPGDTTITSYQILRRDITGGGVLATHVDNTGSADASYVDVTSVAASNSYVYRIKARNSIGLSAQSGFVNVTTNAVPSPTNVAVSASAGDPTVTLNVTAVGASAPTSVAVTAQAGDPTVALDLTAVAPTADGGQYLYVADSTNDEIRVFDWPSRDRNSARDIDVSGETDFPNGVVSDGTHAWVYRDSNEVFAYLLSTGAYDSTHSIAGPSGARFRGGMYWDGVLWFANILSDTVLAYDADTLAALPNRNLSLPTATSNAKSSFASAGIGWVGASSGADRTWYAFQLSDGSRLADRDITVDSTLFGEGAFTDGTHGWALNGRAASAYLLADGVRDNGEDFNLPSSEFGSGRGATIIGGAEPTPVTADVAVTAEAGDPTAS